MNLAQAQQLFSNNISLINDLGPYLVIGMILSFALYIMGR